MVPLTYTRHQTVILIDAMGSQDNFLDWSDSIYGNFAPSHTLRRSIMSTIRWTNSSINFGNETSKKHTEYACYMHTDVQKSPGPCF